MVSWRLSSSRDMVPILKPGCWIGGADSLPSFRTVSLWSHSFDCCSVTSLVDNALAMSSESRSGSSRWHEVELGSDLYDLLVAPDEEVDGRDVAVACGTPAEGIGQLVRRSRSIEYTLLGHEPWEVERGGLKERQRRDQTGEVVVEAGRCGQHRLQRHLVRGVVPYPVSTWVTSW